MSNFFCKYKLSEISRMLSHADMHILEHSRTFHQVMHLLISVLLIAVIIKLCPDKGPITVFIIIIIIVCLFSFFA